MRGKNARTHSHTRTCTYEQTNKRTSAHTSVFENISIYIITGTNTKFQSEIASSLKTVSYEHIDEQTIQQ